MSKHLESMVANLSAKGLSNREISWAFKRRFEVKVSFKGGKPRLDAENINKFRKNEAEIRGHFDDFLKFKGKHANFCRHEKFQNAQPVRNESTKSELNALQKCALLPLLCILMGVLFILLAVRNHLGKTCAAIFLGSLCLALFYASKRDSSDWQEAGHYRGVIAFWAWAMLASGSILLIRFVINWLRNPEVCVGAAKGLYMGQSLNHQREIRESLRDIHDHLDT